MIVTAGKAGAGKSTLINTFLNLHGSGTSKARLQPTSVTQKIESYDGVVNNVNIRVIDIPGLNAQQHKQDEAAAILGELSAFTQGNADVVFYCMSLISKIQKVDWENINTLTKVFGSSIWNHVIFVFTWADIALINGSQIEGLVEEFVEAIRLELTISRKVNTEIRSIYSFTKANETSIDKFNGIVCIPVSKDLAIPHDWRTSLLLQVLRKCPNESIPGALQLTTNITWEELMKVVTSSFPDAAKGADLGKVVGSHIGTFFEEAYKLKSDGNNPPPFGGNTGSKIGSFVGGGYTFASSIIMKILSILRVRRIAIEQAHVITKRQVDDNT